MEILTYGVTYHDESGNAAEHSIANYRDAVSLFERIAGWESVDTHNGFPMPEQWETLGWETYNIESRGYVFTRYSEEVGNWSATIYMEVRHDIDDESMAHVINKTSERYGVTPESVRVTEVTEYPGEGVTVTVAYGDYAYGSFGTATWGVVPSGITIYQD